MYVNSAHQSVHIEGQLLRLCRMMQNAGPQELQGKGGRFIGRSVNPILTRGGGQIVPTKSKFRYSEKATKSWSIFLSFLHYLVTSNYNYWKMGQMFVAFSEYLNFTTRPPPSDFTTFLRSWNAVQRFHLVVFPHHVK